MDNKSVKSIKESLDLNLSELRIKYKFEDN
jgi:hypothetical protein